MRRWYGIERGDRWAILGGQLVAPVTRQRPPYWVWNFALRQLYLSAYHLAPDNVGAYLEAMRRHEVVYLLGYPSGLYALAQVALERGLAAPRLRVVIGNAEPLLAHQRQAIEAAFACPARETYGMAEYAAAGSDCQHGRLHLWPEAGHVELLADGATTRSARLSTRETQRGRRAAVSGNEPPWRTKICRSPSSWPIRLAASTMAKPMPPNTW